VVEVREETVMVEAVCGSCYDFPGGRVFALRGELDISSCPGLAEHLVAPPGALIVVDLAALTFMDSSGLGVLHAARRVAIKDGGSLIVTRPNAMVRRVMEMTGLDIWIVDWDPNWANPH
jgi:anti-sigma B factor antagonist